MTNQIIYLVQLNGRVIKRGKAHVNMRKLKEFENEILSEFHCGKNDKLELLFR